MFAALLIILVWFTVNSLLLKMLTGIFYKIKLDFNSAFRIIFYIFTAVFILTIVVSWIFRLFGIADLKTNILFWSAVILLHLPIGGWLVGKFVNYEKQRELGFVKGMIIYGVLFGVDLLGIVAMMVLTIFFAS